MRVAKRALARARFDPRPLRSSGTLYSPAAQPPYANTQVNLRFGRWCSSWATAGQWVPPLFHSTNLQRDGLEAKLEGYRSRRVDHRIAAIQRLRLTAQAVAWNALARQVEEGAFPVIPLAYDSAVLAEGSTVHGLHVDPATGMPTWQTIWLG